MADLTTAWGEYAEPGEETARLRKTFLAALHEHARAELDAMGDALLPSVRRAWETAHLHGRDPYAGMCGDLLAGAEHHRLTPEEEAVREELLAACRLHIPPGLFAPWFVRWAVGEIEAWAFDRDATQERVWTWGRRDGPLPPDRTEVRIDVRAIWDPYTCTRAEAERALRAELDRRLTAELDRVEAAAAERGERVESRTRESEKHAAWSVRHQVKRETARRIARDETFGEATVKQAIKRMRELLDLPRVEATEHAGLTGRPRKEGG